MRKDKLDNAKSKLQIEIEDKLYSACKMWAKKKSLEINFWRTQGQFFQDFQKKLLEFNNVFAEFKPLVEKYVEEEALAKKTLKDLLTEKNAERFKQLSVQLDEVASNLCASFNQNRGFIREIMLMMEFNEKYIPA